MAAVDYVTKEDDAYLALRRFRDLSFYPGQQLVEQVGAAVDVADHISSMLLRAGGRGTSEEQLTGDHQPARVGSMRQISLSAFRQDEPSAKRHSTDILNVPLIPVGPSSGCRPPPAE
jgi:hypothetical protein